jgi:hypothetical protein
MGHTVWPTPEKRTRPDCITGPSTNSDPFQVFNHPTRESGKIIIRVEKKEANSLHTTRAKSRGHLRRLNWISSSNHSDQAAAPMERGALGRRQRGSRVGIDERVELELLRHPEHGLLLQLLRHHRHLHAGRRRDADGHGERVVLLGRVHGRQLLPPCGVLVQAVQQQLVEAPRLQEPSSAQRRWSHRVLEGLLGMLLLARDEMLLFFTSLLSVSWLLALVLDRAVTRASSQPDDPALISPKLMAGVLFEPPAQQRPTRFGANLMSRYWLSGR